MKILFLTSRLPYPPYGGDKLRVYNFIKYLSRRHSVYLISFIESEKELEFVEPVKKYCASVETVLLKPIRSYINCMLSLPTLVPFQVVYYRDKKMRNKVEDVINKQKFDGAYVHLIRMAQYVKDIKNINRVLDLTDSLSLSLRRSLKYRNHIFFLFYFSEWLKVKRYESRIVKYFDKCLLISKSDLKAEAGLDKAPNISIISNGVDLEYFRPSERPKDPKKLVFIGNLHSFPNRDAVLYFCSRVLPLIKTEVPDVKFYIVGANPSEKIKGLHDGKSIFVTGPVDDTRRYLSDAAALVCPIRVATGMQNKIMEAMAMGLPVVSTSIATQWLTWGAESGILVSDLAEDFARNAVSIIKDDELRNRVSILSRKYAENNFDWSGSIEYLEGIFKEGAKSHA